MTRVGDLAHQQLLLSFIKATQARLADTQLQAATGQKAQRYSAMAAATQQLLSVEDTRERYQRYIDNIVLADQRAQLADLSMGEMEEQAKEMRGLLTSIPKDYQTLGELARNYLRSVSDLLNIKDATRSLFAGSNTAGPAVQIYEPGTADPAAPFAGVPGGNSYRYKILATGVASDSAIKVSDTLQVNASVNANPAAPATANAFTKVLDALIRVADFGTAANPTPSQADVDTAVAELSAGLKGDTVAGITGLDELRSQLAMTRKTIDTIKGSHQQFLKYAVDTISNTERADMAEVAAMLTAQQTQLEASYAALARINATSLLDFLR
jgi:flagellar hook-associated protein 3 FlgL